MLLLALTSKSAGASAAVLLQWLPPTATSPESISEKQAPFPVLPVRTQLTLCRPENQESSSFFINDVVPAWNLGHPPTSIDHSSMLDEGRCASPPLITTIIHCHYQFFDFMTTLAPPLPFILNILNLLLYIYHNGNISYYGG